MNITIQYLIIFIFLAVVSFIILPLIHELGHFFAFRKYGIDSKIEFRFIKYIQTTFKKKISIAHCFVKGVEEKKFYSLDDESKKEIVLGGIKLDLISLICLALIILILNLPYFINKYVFLINVILSGLSALQLGRTFMNTFYKKSDVQRLPEILKHKFFNVRTR